MTRRGGGQTSGGQGDNVPPIVGEKIIGELAAPAEGVTGAGTELLISTQSELVKILAVLTTVNDIRAQVIRLGLNPSLRLAVDTEVVPVLSILTSLATAADFYSVAAFNLSNINFAKTHEIKKILNLVYDITDVSESVLEVTIKLILATLPKSPG